MNAPGTWEHLGIEEPKQIYRTCLVHEGVETTLSADDLITECNRWDPMSVHELNELQERRDLYTIRINRTEGVL